MSWEAVYQDLQAVVVEEGDLQHVTVEPYYSGVVRFRLMGTTSAECIASVLQCRGSNTFTGGACQKHFILQ